MKRFTIAARVLFKDATRMIIPISPRLPKAGEYGLRIEVPDSLNKVKGYKEPDFQIAGSDLHAGWNNLGEVGFHADSFLIGDVYGNKVEARILQIWHNETPEQAEQLRQGMEV